LQSLLRRQILGSRRRQLGFGRLEIGDELRFVMQPRDRGGPKEAAFDHVELGRSSSSTASPGSIALGLRAM
jgi:hypothetical protein